MAWASAWLALAFGLLQVSLKVYGITTSVRVIEAPLYLDFYQVLPGLMCIAGGVVVLRRVRPGLRLLSAAWAFSLGLVLVRMTDAIVQYETLKQNNPISTKVGEPVYEPAFPIHLAQQDTLVLVCALTGLFLALLARRPTHKN